MEAIASAKVPENRLSVKVALSLGRIVTMRCGELQCTGAGMVRWGAIKNEWPPGLHTLIKLIKLFFFGL